MGRKFYLPLIAMLFIGIGAFAQSGEIRGKVTEKGGKEGVPFASVAALLNANADSGQGHPDRDRRERCYWYCSNREQRSRCQAR